MNDEPKLIVSKKSQPISSGGKTVYVEIYRMESEKRWAMAIDDEFSNTSIWDKTFKSEKAALLEAKKSILEEGISNLLDLKAVKVNG
jgi:delta 1-pyrroline-5-carboxylate dehydrogenase